MEKNTNKILYKYFSAHDVELNDMGLSRRSNHALQKAGFDRLSQMVLLREEEIATLPAIGAKSVEEIVLYLQEKSKPIEWAIESGLITEDNYQDPTAEETYEMILDAMAWENTYEMSLEDLYEIVSPELSRNKYDAYLQVLAERDLLSIEDDRCILMIPEITDLMDEMPDSDEKAILVRRLAGESLESVGKEYGWTKENVRMKQNKALEEMRHYLRNIYHVPQLGNPLYQYLYENYDLSREIWLEEIEVSREWLNLISILYKAKKTRKPASDLCKDEYLPEEIRAITPAADTEKTVIIEGNTLPKQKSSLEDYIASKYCRQEKSLDEFIDQYTAILADHKVEDESLRLTRANRRGAITNLRRNRNILWKQNEKLRYYDFDAYDFSELLQKLDLKRFGNCYVSTRKFMREFADLMKQYDIQDEYELHGVLHVICSKKDYPDLKFGRMPALIFGKADRRAQMLSLLNTSRMIDEEEMYRLLNDQYGIDRDAARQRWLPLIADLNEDGYYSI